MVTDYVSNEYSFIMDNLNITSLKLIDTYGLDHVNWDGNKKQVLSNIVYDLVEKRMVNFDSSLAVIYVKKLDSGKPTEIKNIIPQIYNIIPQSPVYCVFNGLNIISDSVLVNLKKGVYDNAIDNIILDIFKASSKTNWNSTHWKTRLANYKRINKKEKLGYWGTYQHQWNQLFHMGYIRIIAKRENNFLQIKETGGNVVALDSCIKNMENEFLGQSYQLSNVDINNEEKGEFRKLLEEMYELGVADKRYIDNPFAPKKADSKNWENDSCFLNDICNFEKGYELISKKLISYFKKSLEKQIENENNAKKENLKKINHDFYLEYQKQKFEFNKKYPEIDFDGLFRK